MTRSLNPVAVSLLIEAAESLQKYVKDADPRQEPLDLTGENQAIDAFMAERQDLKESLRYAQYEVNVLADNLEEEIDRSTRLEREVRQAKEDIEKAVETLIKVAEYVGQLKELLVRIGISVGHNEADGTPKLLIDRTHLAYSLDHAFPM